MLAPSLLALTLLAGPDLRTTAEKTGFERTGRYDEAVRLCSDFQKAFPGKARCTTFGTTPEGRPMLALVASADGTLDPAAAKARKRPVVLFQGGIHAGEIDGKDAGFWAMREWLGQGSGSPLSKVTAVFVPVFNVDGHERFGKNNRPNQRGPAEMGWRTTAQNYNLNRDYVKADAPETQALLRLLGAWDPIVYADLHVTDGAQFRHDVGIIVEPRHAGDAGLMAEGAKLEGALVERLTGEGYLPLAFYPSFRTNDDPTSGIEVTVPPPRYGHGYWAAHDRFGILVETHSWRPYAHRVKLTHDFLRALLDLAAVRGAAWCEAAARADAASAALAGAPLPLSFAATDRSRPFPFQGYAYTRDPSPVSGRPAIRYDETRPAVWEIPLFDERRPDVTVTLPKGGWIVPPAHAAWVADKLRLHRIRFEPLRAGATGVAVEAFRATEAKFAARSFEGHQQLTVKGAWAPETRDVEPGALWVPVAQPAARVAATLLEPTGPDSLAAWGFFNNAFERKEYLESYVTEAFAQDLLARDPAVRAEFERRLADDEAFAKSPEERLLFFAQRHPSWDDRYRLYPVLRADRRPGAR